MPVLPSFEDCPGYVPIGEKTKKDHSQAGHDAFEYMQHQSNSFSADSATSSLSSESFEFSSSEGGNSPVSSPERSSRRGQHCHHVDHLPHHQDTTTAGLVTGYPPILPYHTVPPPPSSLPNHLTMMMTTSATTKNGSGFVSRGHHYQHHHHHQYTHSQPSSPKSTSTSSLSSSPQQQHPLRYRKKGSGAAPTLAKWEPDHCVALDAEMVGVGQYGEDSAIARVVIVDWYGTVLFDEYIKQTQPVTDYRTFISGITKGDLDGAELSLRDARKQILKILYGRLLIGHGLRNDLKALGLSHPWWLIRDVSLGGFYRLRWNPNRGK